MTSSLFPAGTSRTDKLLLLVFPSVEIKRAMIVRIIQDVSTSWYNLADCCKKKKKQCAGWLFKVVALVLRACLAIVGRL